MTSPDEVAEQQLGPRHVAPGTRRAVVFAIAFVILLIPVYLLAAGQICADGRCGPVPTPDVQSPVDGVVISVDSSGLADVRGFTLRPSNGGGFAFGFSLGDLENPTEFPPSHLAEHLASSEPVRVYFRTENGVHIAYRLEDAPG